MRTSNELRSSLVNLMNRIAEADRRGQTDVVETLVKRAARELVDLANLRAAERNRAPRAMYRHFNFD
jgi:hypothetical protein